MNYFIKCKTNDEQRVERRNKVFDWLEKTRVQHWCTADSCACNGCIQNSYDDIEITETEFIEWLQYKHATLTQQFTDYRKQSEGEIERLKKELTLRSGVRYTLMIDEIKQSGERIERLEAALRFFLESFKVSNDKLCRMVWDGTEPQ